MERNNEKPVINVNIAEYNGEKPIEVVYRDGMAAEEQQLPLKAPERISIIGVLSTPSDWLSKRVDTIDQTTANVVVDRERMSIALTINETDYYEKNTIKGVAQYSEVYEAFGINNPQKGWVPAKLGQFLRLNRSVFIEKEKCMMLVSQLKNFSAKAKAEIQKQRDPSGSMADVYRCEVESNLPKSFTVAIPIYKGTARIAIEVEFDHYLSDGDVYLTLVSPGAKEIADEYRDNIIDTELDKIREIAPEIVIMEI